MNFCVCMCWCLYKHPVKTFAFNDCFQATLKDQVEGNKQIKPDKEYAVVKEIFTLSSFVYTQYIYTHTYTRNCLLAKLTYSERTTASEVIDNIVFYSCYSKTCMHTYFILCLQNVNNIEVSFTPVNVIVPCFNQHTYFSLRACQIKNIRERVSKLHYTIE